MMCVRRTVLMLVGLVGFLCCWFQPASASETGQLNIPCLLQLPSGSSWKLCIDPAGVAEASFDVGFPEGAQYRPDLNFVSVAYQIINPGHRSGVDLRNVRIRTVTNAPPGDPFVLAFLGVEGQDLAVEQFDVTPNFIVEADSYSSAVLADEPLAYWRLNETEGERAKNVGRHTNLEADQDALDGKYVGGNLDAPGPPLPGFSRNWAYDVGAGPGDQFVGVDFEFVASPLNDLEQFTFSGWVRPSQMEFDRTGLWGQNDALELGFINSSAIQMWTPGGGSATWNFVPGEDIRNDQWFHLAVVGDGNAIRIYKDGQLEETGGVPTNNYGHSSFDFNIGGGGVFDASGNQFEGSIDEVAIWDAALTQEQIQAHFDAAFREYDPPVFPGLFLQAGDADQDLDFDQFDLIQVQKAAKYMTGQPATWGEGDWNRAPGGAPGSPPPGDGWFNQLDLVVALHGDTYVSGPYAAVRPRGHRNDGQTSVIYDPETGEVAVDAPAGGELTSVNIDSAAGIFTGEPAENLGGSFDNDENGNIFKATFGGSFGTVSFGHVAQAGLSEAFLLADLTIIGSLAGGGDLGDVDLIYVPEPATIILAVLGLLAGLVRRLRPCPRFHGRGARPWRPG